MEKNKLVESLKSGQIVLEKYLENLQTVLEKDT